MPVPDERFRATLFPTLRFCWTILPAAWCLGGCQDKPGPDPAQAEPPRLAEEVAKSADWSLFQSRFITIDGRVVDTGNGNVSHSEGQGYGMLIAEHFGDRAAFDRLWTWTRDHLQRNDKLLSWRWRPDNGTDTKGHVDDPNNATDGELLIAWALLRGHARWGDSRYRENALDILHAVQEKQLLAESSRGWLIVPGLEGFHRPKGTVINLSYWLFPALPSFDEASGDGQWRALDASGRRLIQQARFGHWRLPSDWVLVPKEASPLEPAEGFPPEFGYNAIRIPLYLVWAGETGPDLLGPFARFWTENKINGNPAATVNVENDQLAEYALSPGGHAVARLTIAASAGQPLSSVEIPSLDDTSDYYSACLLMLSKIAIADQLPGGP